MTTYRLSPDAEIDLNEIWEYIALHNLDAADRLIGRLYDAIHILAARPGLGHRREDLTQVASAFFWPVGAYLIVYRRLPTAGIDVIAVAQGSRNSRTCSPSAAYNPLPATLKHV